MITFNLSNTGNLHCVTVFHALNSVVNPPANVLSSSHLGIMKSYAVSNGKWFDKTRQVDKYSCLSLGRRFALKKSDSGSV